MMFLSIQERGNIMDDLIKICDELENCSKSKICIRNEVVCTKKVLKRYVGSDYDKILKIKAEIDIHKDFDSITLNGLSLLVSFITLLVTVIYNICAGTKTGILVYFAYAVLCMVILLVITTIILVFQRKTSSRSKWIKYISVVIEDMKKEHDSYNN